MGLSRFFTDEEHAAFLKAALNADDHPLLPVIAKAITKFGSLINDYELKGKQHIPKKGAALIVMYHGLVPLDLWYGGLHIYLETGRLGHALADNFVFHTPGLRELARAVGAVPGNPESALALLKSGEIVGVCPGGVKEAISGTENNYKVLWGKRTGFAKLALDAKVPIIPGFTQNIEEAYHAPFAGSPIIQDIYEKTRLPLLPIFGLGAIPFPVKLTTWLGKPIPYDAQDTPEKLAAKTKRAIEGLIKKHQKDRKNVVERLKERFDLP